MVIPFRIATTIKDEKYPSVTYFVQMVGANTSKKDVNSYIKTVTDEGVSIEDTPNYTTYQIQNCYFYLSICPISSSLHQLWGVSELLVFWYGSSPVSV